MPNHPDVPYFEITPNWVCKVLSPSTRRTSLVRGSRHQNAGSVRTPQGTVVASGDIHRRCRDLTTPFRCDQLSPGCALAGRDTGRRGRGRHEQMRVGAGHPSIAAPPPPTVVCSEPFADTGIIFYSCPLTHRRCHENAHFSASDNRTPLATAA